MMESSKSTKRALISSALAILMCVAMLIGTTFAWFTDTASTGVNKIQAGNLDVDIIDLQGHSLDGKTLKWQKASGAENEDVLWEPGCTYYLTPFQIQNKGSLALKYKVVINGVSGDSKLLEALEFGFYYFSVGFGEERSLDELIEGGKLDNVAEYPGLCTAPIYIVAHMKEEAGNEYQGLTIDDIGITVYATQDTYENDSFGNTYDENADYTLQVNKNNIQDYLDGKYGPINGMTLVLAEGDYDKIEFGRATAYVGSNTKYYLGGAESNVDAIKQDIANHPNGGAGAREYVRYMNNVTLKAADNATVTINGLVAYGGQVSSTKWYSRDFVADRDMSATENNNISYWIGQKWNNITFEGLTFTGGVNIEAYGNKDTLIDNVKFDNCKFNIANNADATYCIRLNVD